MFNRTDWWCENNPESSFTTKVKEHIPSRFSMSTISSFKNIENKYDVYIWWCIHDVYRKRLHEKVLWIFNIAHNGDN